MHNVNGLSCMGCSAGMLPEIHTKADQHCRAKRLFVDDTIHNDLLQEFITKTIVSFRNRLWSCVAAAGRHWVTACHSQSSPPSASMTPSVQLANCWTRVRLLTHSRHTSSSRSLTYLLDPFVAELFNRSLAAGCFPCSFKHLRWHPSRRCWRNRDSTLLTTVLTGLF